MLATNKGTSNALITVVIPTYQRSSLLRRAILSALKQSYANIVVLVCDNASNDDTEAVVTHMSNADPRIVYIKHNENIGSYRNFNSGLAALKTKYFCLLSDDDLLAPDFIKNALAAFAKYPNAAAVAMPTASVDENEQILELPQQVSNVRLYPAGEGISANLASQLPNKWSGYLIDQRVFREIGGLDLEAGPYADAGYIWHILARYPVVANPGLAAIYMVHQATTSANVKALDAEWPTWWERMITRIESDLSVAERVRNKVRAQMQPDFRKIAVEKILQMLYREQPKLAIETARGLAGCGYPKTAEFLLFVIRIWTNLLPNKYITKKVHAARAPKKAAEKNRKNTQGQDITALVNALNGATEEIAINYQAGKELASHKNS
jgi:GT2 family glycosyltransferase